MHLEPPKSPLHSFRAFAGEYLMIVVSILTALGLEHVITKHHHVTAAEKAQQQIVIELRTNLQEVRWARQKNLERKQPLAGLITSLKEDIQAKASKATINQHLLARLKGFVMGFAMPTLKHEAWDVVVANQSASHMDVVALRRYSAAYAAQRESMALAAQSFSAPLNLPLLLDAITDIELQQADPLACLRAMKQYAMSLDATQNNLGEIQTQLETTLKDEPAEAAPPSVAH